MYNESQKKQYIEYKLNNAKLNRYYLGSVFKKTEPFEEKLGKDVSTFTVMEIDDMYKVLNFGSYGTLALFNSALNGYTNWCLTQLRNVPDSQNHFLEFDSKRLKTIAGGYKKDHHLLTAEQVNNIVNQLVNPADKFIVLGSFEGLSGENNCEFWKLKEDDISTIKDEINLPERGIRKFSHRLCVIGVESAQTFEYYPLNADDTRKPIKLVEPDLVMKNLPNAVYDDRFHNGRRVYTKFSKIMKYFGYKDVRLKDVYYSGMIDMINTNAKKEGVSGIDWYMKNRDKVLERYADITYMSASPFKARYGEYLV